jgi:hypothetical protein
MFKKSLAIVVLFSVISTLKLSAQDTTHTLLKFRKPESIGIYVAPEFQYGSLNGDFTNFGGGSLMLMVNNRFAFGVTGQSSISNTFSPKNSSPLFVRSQFGGGKIEYSLNPNSAIHVTLPLVVGIGEVQADSLSGRSGFFGGGERNNNYYNRRGNSYVVIQPGVNVEANMLKFMKLFVGVNYRFSILNDNNSTVLPASALQGVSISAGVKMGIFNYHFGKKKEMPVQN